MHEYIVDCLAMMQCPSRKCHGLHWEHQSALAGQGVHLTLLCVDILHYHIAVRLEETFLLARLTAHACCFDHGLCALDAQTRSLVARVNGACLSTELLLQVDCW